MPSAAHTCRHHAFSFGHVRKAFSRNVKSLSIISTLRSHSPTSASHDQNGLLEKNQDVSSHSYPQLESQAMRSQGWSQTPQFQSKEINDKRRLPKSVPTIIGGGEQDTRSQSHNQHPYARLGSQSRPPPKGLPPPTAAPTPTSGGRKLERNHKLFARLDDYSLSSESFNEVPPPVPHKDIR